MSADNVIYISKINGWWHVWMDFLSNDNSSPGGKYHREYKRKTNALKYAFEIMNDVYVENDICIWDFGK